MKDRHDGGADAGVQAESERAEAFRVLVDRNMAASHRLATVILRDPVEAEDALHDALLTAWLGWPRLRDRSRLEAWFQCRRSHRPGPS